MSRPKGLDPLVVLTVEHKQELRRVAPLATASYRKLVNGLPVPEAPAIATTRAREKRGERARSTAPAPAAITRNRPAVTAAPEILPSLPGKLGWHDSTVYLSPESRHLLEALPDKRQLFALALAATGEAQTAGKVAGYTASSTAVTAANDSGVRHAVESIRSDIADRLGITAEYVLSKLKQNVEQSLTGQPVLNKYGEPTGTVKYDGMVANRALELLGKHLGLFSSETIEVDTKTLTVKIVREGSVNSASSNKLELAEVIDAKVANSAMSAPETRQPQP